MAIIKVVNGYELPVIIEITTGDVMYHMIAIVNTALACI